jgi:hypothetical protein
MINRNLSKDMKGYLNYLMHWNFSERILEVLELNKNSTNLEDIIVQFLQITCETNAFESFQKIISFYEDCIKDKFPFVKYDNLLEKIATETADIKFLECILKNPILLEQIRSKLDFLFTALISNRKINNKLEVIQLLIQQGIDFDNCQHRGKTPLHYAFQQKDKVLITELLKHIPYNDEEYSDNKTAIELFVEGMRIYDISLLSELLEFKDVGKGACYIDQSGKTILHRLMINNEFIENTGTSQIIRILRILIGSGADIQVRDQSGKLFYDYCEDPEIKELIIDRI